MNSENGTNPKNLTINELRKEAVDEYKKQIRPFINRVIANLAANMNREAYDNILKLETLNNA